LEGLVSKKKRGGAEKGKKSEVFKHSGTMAKKGNRERFEAAND